MPRERLKVVVIGHTGAGMTSLVHRLVHGSFREQTEVTFGVEINDTTIRDASQNWGRDNSNDNGVDVPINIWTTSGIPRFAELIPTYVRKCHGIIAAYDTTDSESLNHCEEKLKMVFTHAPANTCKVIVGTKCDLVDQREVSAEAAKEFAERHGIPLLETSAKTGTGVQEAFTMLAQQMCTAHPNAHDAQDARTSQRASFTCYEEFSMWCIALSCFPVGCVGGACFSVCPCVSVPFALHIFAHDDTNTNRLCNLMLCLSWLTGVGFIVLYSLWVWPGHDGHISFASVATGLTFAVLVIIGCCISRCCKKYCHSQHVPQEITTSVTRNQQGLLESSVIGSGTGAAGAGVEIV